MKSIWTTAMACVALAGLAAVAAWATETVTYTYDARGRLVRVVRGGSVNNNVTANYSYDRADNRTSVNVASPHSPQ
ncbi:MAG TPA: hypothetical protein VGW40_03200 [Allosphingosinicella sp.]|nr:hypothetical protein [Allosphingosinicella sp.]